MCKYALIISIAMAGTALTVNISSAESLVVISLAGEAFDGPPAFAISADGKVIGSGTLSHAIETEKDGRLFTKPRPGMFLEQFSFEVPDASLLPDKEISIALTNDKFAERQGEGEDGILDRNLYIDFISVNGLEVTSADMALIKGDEVQHLDYQAGLLPVYESDHRAVVRPPLGGWTPPVAAASLVFDPGQAPMPALASWTLRALEQNQ